MSKIIPLQCNLIAAGAWNPAIIQPHWLKQQFGEKIQDECSIDVIGNGANFVLRLNYKNFIIDPFNGRLVLTPKNEEKETFQYIVDLALGIRDKLSHTPIISSGSNFAFKLDDAETFRLDEVETDQELQGIYSDLNKQGKMVSRSIRHTFGLKDCTINIIYEYEVTQKTIRFNFDYQKPNPLQRAAEAFGANYTYATELCGQLTRR